MPTNRNNGELSSFRSKNLPPKAKTTIGMAIVYPISKPKDKSSACFDFSDAMNLKIAYEISR